MVAKRLSLRAVTFALMASAYLLLSGQTSADELVAAVVIAAAAVALAQILSRVSERAFVLQGIGWPRLIGGTLARLAREVMTVGAVLTSRQPTDGRFERQRFIGIREDEQAEAGRRAVVTLATSLTPASFVIGVLTAHHELLLHRLAPRRASEPRPASKRRPA